MVWSCSTDGFLNLTAFLLCKWPFYEKHTGVCERVCVCRWVSLCTFQIDWMCSMKYLVIQDVILKLYFNAKVWLKVSKTACSSFCLYLHLTTYVHREHMRSFSLIYRSLLCLFVPASDSEVGGIGEETAACDWWSLGAILFELLTGMVSQKKVFENVVFVTKSSWDVCRCLGFQHSHTLFVVVPSCVWFCMCLGVCCSGFCLWMCVRCVLAAASYSGSQGVPGVSVWLSPPAWAPSAGPRGQLSLGLSAGSRCIVGLRSFRPHIGVEGEDGGRSRDAALHCFRSGTVLRHRLLKQPGRRGRGDQQIHTCLLYTHIWMHMLIITCCSLEGRRCTRRCPNAGAAMLSVFLLSI